MKALQYQLIGESKFIVPEDKRSQFEAALNDGKLRLSVDVDLPKALHTVGFDPSDVVSGAFHVVRDGDEPGSYKISVDAVLSTLSLGKKEAAEIDAGRATCQFSDVGFGSDWYPEMQFSGDVKIKIAHIK